MVKTIRLLAESLIAVSVTTMLLFSLADAASIVIHGPQVCIVHQPNAWE